MPFEKARQAFMAADSGFQNPWAFDPNNASAGLDAGFLERLKNGSGGRALDPNGRYQYLANEGDVYNPEGTIRDMNGGAFWDFDKNTGQFLRYRTKAADNNMGVLLPLGAAALGIGLAGFGGAGAGGAAGAGGSAVGGAGGFVGEGALSGVGAWDGALAGAGGTTGMGAAGAAGAASAGASGAGGVASTVGKALGGFSWDSLIGPGLSAVSGMYGSNQAGKAADAQIAAAREAQATLKPWTDAGGWAVGQAANMLGKNGATAAKNAFTMDPGYQFRLDQGNKALERAAAARGLGASGKYLKDAMAYNQGQASQEFTNSYNRLTNLAGLGQTSANNSADYGTQAGNAAAAGRIGSANAFTNALGQGYSMYANSQQQNANNNILAQVLSRRY